MLIFYYYYYLLEVLLILLSSLFLESLPLLLHIIDGENHEKKERTVHCVRKVFRSENYLPIDPTQDDNLKFKICWVMIAREISNYDITFVEIV